MQPHGHIPGVHIPGTLVPIGRRRRSALLLLLGEVSLRAERYAPKIIADTCSAACDCMPGRAWLYTFIVVAIDECPWRSRTTFGCRPASNASVAHV
jgi:hypothetical protein